MADITTPESILEKSGVKKNSSPLAAPGVVRAHTTSTTMRRKRKGMRIFDERSMPLFTPRTTTKCVAKRKAARQSSGNHGSETKLLKLSAKTEESP